MAIETISQAGSFTDQTRKLINDNFSEIAGSLIQVGTIVYLDPVSGTTGGDGLTLGTAVSDLATAWGKVSAGQNDVIVLVGNGAASGTARLSSAFTWSKAATHLVGISAPTSISNRSRIAPTSGATAFTPLMTISADGCIFQNIQWFHGFDTGTTSQICLDITSSRCFFRDCHIAGMGDQESADNAGSRSVRIGTAGSGENLFVRCTIGLDTVTRGAANASVEFRAATPRNRFIECVFPFQTDSADVLGIIASGTGSMDRWQLFERCSFINNVQSTSTTMTALATLATSAGGLLFMKSSSALGITDWGTDANSKALTYLDGAAPTANTSGLAVASS